MDWSLKTSCKLGVCKCVKQKRRDARRGSIFVNFLVELCLGCLSRVIVVPVLLVMNESENSTSISNNRHDLTKLPAPNPLRYPTLYDLYFVFTKKMKLILALGIGLAFLSVVGACLFRNPTLFMYPLHASCNITWTFKQDCIVVREKLMLQMEIWKGDTTCGMGQKCLYSLGEVKGNEVHGTHTSPTRANYVDDLDFKFYTNSATKGCNVLGYSTSRLYFALLDFGTNYCNLHNLVEGAGLISDPHYSELTRDEICTQYTSSNCDKY